MCAGYLSLPMQTPHAEQRFVVSRCSVQVRAVRPMHSSVFFVRAGRYGIAVCTAEKTKRPIRST
jgi:hypothetical protein